MSDRRRVCVVLGTRPEAIKLFPVILALRDAASFDARVCITGQHGAALTGILSLAGIVPDHALSAMRGGQSLDALTAALLTGTGEVLDRERPARVLVQGDTASAMTAALAAYHRRIPVAHVEAGLRSHDILNPWPEEVARKVIGAIADVHFAPTATARDALLQERVAARRVHVTGNTVIDALHRTTAILAERPALGAVVDALAGRFTGRSIVAVTCHRRENLGAGIDGIAEALARLAARADAAFIVPLHPNPQVRGPLAARLTGLDNVALVEPLDYPQFIRLLQVCRLVLSDSGGVQEEAPALGRPVLVLRGTTERPEGIAAGTARLVGTEPDAIVGAVTRLLDDPAAYEAMATAHNPYGDGHAAARIAHILAES